VGPDPLSGWPTGTLATVNLGAPELIIVLLIILLIFGGAKLPQLARSLGKAQSEFKKGSEEGNNSSDEATPPI
jgi:sec-independent protein translocase protein TatA